MADVPTPPRYKITELVRTAGNLRLEGRVMEVMPAMTPQSHTLYTVYVPMDPEPLILLLREDEMEKV